MPPDSNLPELTQVASVWRETNSNTVFPRIEDMTCTTILDALLSGVGSFFTALFGAGAGAYAAYRFAVKQQEDNERTTQYRAATTALFTLLARFSAVENFRRNALKKDGSGIISDRETGFFYQYTPDTKLDFPSLSFMADPTDSELLHDLRLSESHFFNFVEGLRERNEHLAMLLKGSTIHEFDPESGESVISSNPIEVKIYTDQNRDLVSGAIRARDSTHNQSPDPGIPDHSTRSWSGVADARAQGHSRSADIHPGWGGSPLQRLDCRPKQGDKVT